MSKTSKKSAAMETIKTCRYCRQKHGRVCPKKESDRLSRAVLRHKQN